MTRNEMSFSVNIQNFGKLADANVQIGRFTVLAGPNNTGKSFVSKLLYSLFDGMNTHHALFYFNDVIAPVRASLENFSASDENEVRQLAAYLEVEISRVENLLSTNEISEIEGRLPEIRVSLDNILGALGKEQLPMPSKTWNSFVKDMQVPSMLKKMREMDARRLIMHGISSKIAENVMRNFQVANPSSLRREGKPLNISIADIGRLFFNEHEHVNFSIEMDGYRKLQDYSRVIYLESPAYWKLKLALEHVRATPRFYHYPGRIPLQGVPGYFYDLAGVLGSEYTGKVAFPGLFEKLTSKVIGGKLVIAETGELVFQEAGNSFSLHLTSMGVVNLGMIALLIERKIMDKGAFLFIDEPEAHLHPAWQVIMVKTLFELAKGGVNVVIATHSPDILKWLEVHVKHNPDDEILVALNKFPMNGAQVEEQDFGYKMAAIKEDLTRPFADLYMAGL